MLGTKILYHFLYPFSNAHLFQNSTISLLFSPSYTLIEKAESTPFSDPEHINKLIYFFNMFHNYFTFYYIFSL
jgi:hypothetical protein